LKDLDASLARAKGYAAAVAAAVTAHGSRAFVLEGVFDARDDALFGTELRALVDPAAKLTRLSAIFDAAALVADVTFDAPAPSDVPTRLGAVTEGPSGHGGAQPPAALAACFLVILAAARRRRSRRYPQYPRLVCPG